MSTRLVVATPAHFGWVRGEGPPPEDLRLPQEGLDAPDVLAWLARKALEVEAAIGHPGAWLVASGDEVVGLISFKDCPSRGPSGDRVEIGYGIVPSARRRGHATRAVGLVAAFAGRELIELVAETHETNAASREVLLRNGFVVSGARVDDDEGPLVIFTRSTS